MNLILFLDYAVILRLHDAVMTTFLVFFPIILKTTCVRIVGVAPNDAKYMISYPSSIHYLVVSPLEKDLIQKNVFFALEATQQYHNAHKKKIGQKCIFLNEIFF